MALLFGAICSSALMVFVGGGWKQGVLGYVAWALMPYATMMLTHIGLRFLNTHRPVLRMLTWAIIVTALGGPLLYIDAMFVHVDAQGALVILMIPAIQTAFSLGAAIVGSMWQWRINRRIANAALQSDKKASLPIPTTSNESRLSKFIRTMLLALAFMAALLYAAIAMLQSSDSATISTAEEVEAFINQYCEDNKLLPTSVVLRERFPNLKTDTGWFFFTDDKTYLKMQYPMQWWNGDAIGEPKISEFTATPYAYGVDYHCGDSQ